MRFGEEQSGGSAGTAEGLSGRCWAKHIRRSRESADHTRKKLHETEGPMGPTHTTRNRLGDNVYARPMGFCRPTEQNYAFPFSWAYLCRSVFLYCMEKR